jgi:hypothetical protein
MLYDGLDW